MAIDIFYQDGLKEYDFGPGHPFRGDRFETFYRVLKSRFETGRDYRILKSGPANDQDLLLICRQDYIDFTRQFYRAANLGLPYNGGIQKYQSGDNIPFGKPGKIEEAARLVIGQAKSACHHIHDNPVTRAVSIGGGLHHARPSYGEGFCLYNDVAFCALYLIEHFGLERILVLDTDAHAGNGTSEYFYSDPRVLFIDIHQDPRTIYPGTGFVDQTGEGPGEGFTANIPLPAGAGCSSYSMVFESVVEPLAMEFMPQVIIRNGGSDPHYNDGLTNLGLPMEGFKMIGQRVARMSDACGCKVIDLIASGYNKEVLAGAWLALVAGLAGLEYDARDPGLDIDYSMPYAATVKVVREIRDKLKKQWRCFE